MGSRGPVGMVIAMPGQDPNEVRELRKRVSHRPATSTVNDLTPPKVPSPPRKLTGEAKAEWRRVVPELDKLGLLALVDQALLVQHCEWWAKERAYQAEIDALDEPYIFTPSGRLVAHPVFALHREASDRVSRLADKLFLTPVSRLRASMAAKEADDDGDGILD